MNSFHLRLGGNKLKRIGLVFVLMLLLSPMAFAMTKTVDLGPYKVSFDLGVPCSIKVQEPTESEDLAGGKYVKYQADIKSGNEIAGITLMDYNPSELCNLVETDQIYLKYSLNTMGCQGVQVSPRTIDGIPGALGYALIPPALVQVYYAEYWPDYKQDCGSLRCNILSFFPWDEGTLNLIKSIHVELP
jgi:hypothetical protein